MNRKRLFIAWDKYRKVMSDPFTMFQSQFFKVGKPIGIQLAEDITVLDHIGFEDNKGNLLFQGDVIKINYVEESSSAIFKRMQEVGVDHVYMFFDVESPYLATCYRFHDETNFFSSSDIHGDGVRFLRYLLEAKKCGEKIGNIFENPELLDLIVPGK